MTAVGLKARGGFWDAVDDEPRRSAAVFLDPRTDCLNGTDGWIRAWRIIDLSAITKPMIG